VNIENSAERSPLIAADETVRISTKKRLAFLDALRGLAAVYVILYHMILIPVPELNVPAWISAFAKNGGSGVTLFFVVSTFSLFYTMPARAKEPMPTLDFYVHRFFRIAPLFYFVILLTLVRDHFLFHASHSVREVLANMFFLFNVWPGHEQGFVWASWTIGVEMLFYLIFPLIYAKVKSFRGALSLFFGSLLLWQAVQVLLNYPFLSETTKASVLQWSLLRHLPVFTFGCLCFFALEGALKADHADKAVMRDRLSKGTLMLVLGAYVYLALLSGWLPNIFGSPYYWQGVAYALLLCGLCLYPTRIFVNRCTEYLGKVSYSLYLLHPTVVYLLIPVYRRIFVHVPTNTMALLTCFLTTFLILLPASALTFRFIEQPSIRLGRRLYAKWRAHYYPGHPAILALPRMAGN
jgi:peptidoglycan/LPS O-acetylase OafA/YrhL